MSDEGEHPIRRVDLVVTAPGGEPLPEDAIRRAVGAVLTREGVEAGELSITFLADEPILELNLRYLAHEWVPDVLSFELAPPMLGDIYVGYEQARRQAAEHAIPLEEELVRLAVHGTLHILGHDHPVEPERREASELYRVQEAVVREVFE